MTRRTFTSRTSVLVALLVVGSLWAVHAARGADVTGTITIGGGDVTLAVSTAGDRAVLSFSGAAGQRVSYAVSTDIWNASATIVNPDGSTLAGGGWNYSSGWFSDLLVLAQTGTYQIVIDPSGTYTGSVTSTLYGVPPDPSGPIVADGAQVTQTMGTPGQNAALTFSGTVGEQISLNVDGVSVWNAGIKIQNPDGTTLANGSWNYSSGWFSEVRTLAQTGTYWVLIDPSGSYTGSMTSHLYDVPPDNPEPIAVGGSPLTALLPTPGQRKRYTFSGNVGSTVTLTPSQTSIWIGDLSVLNPDGSTLATQHWGYASPTPMSATLPAAGTYAVLIDPTGAYTAT